MKEFKNLREAFGYQTKCPFCTHRTHLGIEQIESIYEHDRTRERFTLRTGSIQFVIDGHTNQLIACYSGGSLLSGQMIFSLSGTCTTCSKYSFAIGVTVDITNSKLTGLFLNSETFSIEEGQSLYEIRNVYTTEKTEYTRFKKGSSDSKVDFPLIPFDMVNPDKTLDRIKGLLVFL